MRPRFFRLWTALLVLLLGLPAAPARADGTPWVPRYQGPYAPQRFNPSQEIWGFALIGTGAFVGGLGLYTLESGVEEPCGEEGCTTSDATATPELGAGLLVGGIFLAGLGLYFVVTAQTAPRIIVQPPPAPAWSVDVATAPGGGVVRSMVRF